MAEDVSEDHNDVASLMFDWVIRLTLLIVKGGELSDIDSTIGPAVLEEERKVTCVVSDVNIVFVDVVLKLPVEVYVVPGIIFVNETSKLAFW